MTNSGEGYAFGNKTNNLISITLFRAMILCYILIQRRVAWGWKNELELALNRLPEDSTWDAANLKIKIEQLIEYNVDLTFTGFETADMVLSDKLAQASGFIWRVFLWGH